MKAQIIKSSFGGQWFWHLVAPGAECTSVYYTRRRDAKRGLIRFLRGMKKGVEVPE